MPRPKLDNPNYRLALRGNRWVVNWTDPKTGNSKSVSTWQTDHRAAEVWRDQWLAGREQPLPPESPRIGAIVDAYIAARLPHVENTKALQYFGKVIKQHVGNLEPMMVGRRFYIQRRQREGVGPGTIRREVSTLRAALNWAIRERWITESPYLEMPPTPPPRDRWLTREEVKRLLDACGSAHLELFVKLAYHTAARHTAIIELTWDRVDLERRLIHYARPGKRVTKKRRATVPINATAYAALVEAREVATTDHVIEFRGKPIKQTIEWSFRRACRLAGIEDCSPHVLRHTSATHMVIAGVPIQEIARMLGDTVEMVERVYGKHSPDYLRRAADALAD